MPKITNSMKKRLLHIRGVQRFSKALWLMFPMGFASGLPLALSGGTLQAWLTTEGIDIRAIGLFSLVAFPYTFKFIWSPLMDYIRPLPLGRRRGWIFLCQMAIVLACAFMAFLNPKSQLLAVAISALLLAFFSASQDIVIDAYRTDILKEKERGLGVAFTVTGYRIAMLVSGALALILSDFWGWEKTYLLMAAVMALSSIFTILADEPEIGTIRPRALEDAILKPLKDLLKRPFIWGILLFICLYKLGDAFAGTLTTAFLIRGAGFSPSVVGTVNKGFGLVATILGAIVGGGLMTRMGLFSSLFYFGILQAVSNLSFMALSMAGKSFPLMVFSVGLENICGGMGTAAFVAFLMAICNKRFSATQYAILSALSSVGRVFVGPPAGVLVADLGWTVFFFLTFLAALPGLFLLFGLRRPISAL